MDKKPGIIRSTLIGGLLFLLPLVLLVAILGKAMQIAHQVSPPVLRGIRAAHLGDILSPQVVAIILLLAFCIIAGLFARTDLARRIGASLDNVLANIPGYSFYKEFGGSLAGVESATARAIVMVSMEDAWQLAMVVDELEDGLLAVYIPGVPEARSGSLYFVSPDRVRPLSITPKAAMQTLRRMGVGSRELLKGTLLPPGPG